MGMKSRPFFPVVPLPGKIEVQASLFQEVKQGC
jgi:hypothetical protein